MNYPYKSDQQKSVHVTEKLTYQNHMLKILKSLQKIKIIFAGKF